MIRIKADLAEVDRVRDFLRENLRRFAVDEEDSWKLELALHEIFVNIARHAYPGEPGEATIRIWSDTGAVHMEIRDRGIPFNPEETPAIDLEEKIRQGTPGGFGIFLCKTLTDEFSYKRDGDENVITICRRMKNV